MRSYLTFRPIKYSVALFLLAAFFVAGCQREQPPASDDETFNRNLAALVRKPDADLPGHDFRTIPRYPNSQRIVYQEKRSAQNIAYLVAYRTEAKLNQVSSFYEEEMERQGWQLKVKEEKILTMIFVRRELGGGLPLVQIVYQPTERGTIANIIVQDERRPHK